MKTLHISLLVFGLMFLQQGPLQAQNGQKMFQKGMIQEQGEGNLTEAIAIYDAMVNDVEVNRTLRAKALLQMGICYEKLGNQKAIRAYQKLISEYADQTNIVALGKKKLNGLKKIKLSKKNGGITASQLLFSEGNGGRISPDGQSLIYVDWSNIDNKPSINIKDLETGNKRIVSKVGTWEAPIKFPDNPIWSPNGKQFTYYWYDKVKEECEFHIANSDGTNDEVLAKGNNAYYPLAWSPDGQYVLCASTITEGSIQAVLFSIKERSSKILKSFKRKGGKANFSPDSKYIVYSMQQTEKSKENDIYLLSIDGTVDNKIISNDSNDFDPIWSPDGKKILFISDRHGTNDLWEIGIENGRIVGVPKLIKSNLGKRGSSTTILGITKDQSLYYETIGSRSDIYLLKGDQLDEPVLNSAKRISNLNVKENTNPIISRNGRYIAFVTWQLFRDEEIIGRPFTLTIYDTKTEELKETALRLYTLAQLYFYYPKPKWSPDGTKIMIQGRKKVNEKLYAGVYIYDLETETSQAILEMPDYKTFTDDPSTGSDHTFSKDGKSIYYLNTDRKNILKVDIDSGKESVIHTSTKTISNFKVSNDVSWIAFNYYENYKDAYVVNLKGGQSEKIAAADSSNAIYLIGWNPENTHFYYGEGDSENSSIKRISVKDWEPELIFNIKNSFTDGDIREIDIDPLSHSMVVQLGVNIIEMWRLEGVFKD